MPSLPIPDRSRSARRGALGLSLLLGALSAPPACAELMLRNGTDVAMHCQVDARYARADGTLFDVPLVKRVLLYAGQRTPSLPLSAWLGWNLPGHGAPLFHSADLACQFNAGQGAVLLHKTLSRDSLFWQIAAPGMPRCRPEPGARLKLEIARLVIPGAAFKPEAGKSPAHFALRGSCLSAAGHMTAYRVIVPLQVAGAH